MAGPYDVAILGGGLAGLTLGLQLAREQPETSILIAEKRAGPAPEAAFKVGESTVELRALYKAARQCLGEAAPDSSARVDAGGGHPRSRQLREARTPQRRRHDPRGGRGDRAGNRSALVQAPTRA